LTHPTVAVQIAVSRKTAETAATRVTTNTTA